MEPSRREFLQSSFIMAGALNQAQGKFEASYLRLEREKKLKALDAGLWKQFESCSLCPRACGANRLKGEKGICSSTSRLKVFSAAPHFGEERPLVGQGGIRHALFFRTATCSAASARTGRSITAVTGIFNPTRSWPIRCWSCSGSPGKNGSRRLPGPGRRG